jgi:nucleotide-binding universal stress UspA family protein
MSVISAEVDSGPYAHDLVNAVRKIEGKLRHLGIGADAVRIESARGEEGMVLLDEVARRSGDLLVMGGYGRSRMRERIFGGVTQHVLDRHDIPVLIAH